MKFSKVIIMVAVLALLAGQAALAQQPGQQPPPKPPAQGQQPPAQNPPADPGTPAPPPVDPKEEEAFKTFSALPGTDPKALIEQGEAFLKNYPESRHNILVYSKLAAAYFQLDQVDKMTVAGEKALELNPNNVDVLAIMAYAIPRRADSRELDFQQKIQKAERYAKQTIEIMNTLPKPEGMTDEDFTKAKNVKLAWARSGLAVVHFHMRRFPDMVSEMEQSIALMPTPDPVDYYLMGLAYEGAGRPTDAVTAYEKCSATPGQMQAQCNARAATAKKAAAAPANPPKP